MAYAAFEPKIYTSVGLQEIKLEDLADKQVAVLKLLLLQYQLTYSEL